MTKFKVGDKVRILNASEIIGGDEHWNDGDIVKVSKMDGVVWLERSKTQPTVRHPFLHRSEHRYVELVPDHPTKNQRITTLESEVAELKAKVEALEKAQKPMRVSDVADVYYRGEYVGKFPAQSITQNITVKSDADISKVASQLAKLIEGETDKRRKKSPNEQRKAIIAEAKAFVDAQFIEGNFNVGKVVDKHHGHNTVEFVVNPEKRTVVAILRFAYAGNRVVDKAIAKCAPDDVFNADIGKAIALGRALGLDVSRFEQAAKPTKATVGQLLTFKLSDNWHGKVVYRVDDVNKDYDNLTIVVDDIDGEIGIKANADVSYRVGPQLVIYDDTEAVY